MPLHERTGLLEKAKEEPPFSKGKSDTNSDSLEQRIVEHFIKLHAHLELVEIRLLQALNESSSVVSFNAAIGQLSEQTDNIQSVLLKTKKILRNQVVRDYSSLLEELKSFENLPSVFVCSEKEPVDQCLFIDPEIFESLDNHIALTNNSQMYSLVADTEVPEHEVPHIVKMTADEARSLLFSSSRESISTSSDNDRAESRGSNSSRSRTSSISSSSVDTLQSISPPDDLVPGMIIRVSVSHIGSPSNFYIQRDGVGKRLEQLQRGLKRDHQFYSKHRNNVEYREGQLYMMLYEDLSWCRCQLLELFGISQARVLHIDYGVTEVVARAKLLPMPNHYARVPPLAIQCRLVNCFPADGDQWCAKVTPLMLRMLDGPGATWMTVYEKIQPEGWVVQLNKDIETSYIDIGEALVFQGLAVYGETKSTLNMPENVKGRKNLMFPPQPMLREQDLDRTTVELAKIFDPHYFYITIPNGDFKTFHQNFQKECSASFRKSSKVVHYPAIGMAVFARSSNGFWERGLVYDFHPKQQVRVFFVDTGDIEVLNCSDLRVLPSRNFRLHPQAYRCSMSDIAPPDGGNWPSQAAELISSFKMKPLTVADPQMASNGMSILLIRTGAKADVCVNALLVREKLAKSTGPYGNIVEYPKVPSLMTSVEPIIVNQADELRVISPANMPLRKKAAQKSTAASLSEAFCQFAESSDRVIQVNDSIRLKVKIIRYDNPGKFYITLLELNERYEQLFDSIQQYYNQSTDWKKELDAGKTWEKDEKCAVKVNGEWKRGLIESIIDDSRATIKLVDEAGEVSAPTKIGIVAPLQDIFWTMVDRAYKCALGGIQPAASSTWTGTAIFMMEEFITAHRDSLYITKMKGLGPDDRIMRVQLFHRGRIEATAVDPAFDSWTSLNHKLRMCGVARPDAVTEWDSQGNIKNNEVDNALEDETEIFNKMMKEMFLTEANGRLRPRVDSDPCKTTWMPAEPMSNLTIIGKPTFVGPNCEIYFHDILNVTVLLRVINDEANRLCEGTLPPDPPIDWEVGDICLAQFYADNNWYRGEIVKTNVAFAESSIPIHLVKFVDYGNEEFTSTDKIRPATGITMRPIQVQIGHFDNLAPIEETWTLKLIEEVHKIIVDKDCRIELRKLSSGFLAIRSMFLPDGKNVLEEIISRRLGQYRTYGGAKKTPDLPDVVSTQLVEEDFESDQIATGDQPKQFGLNWLNRYDKVDRYELPENFYRFLELPNDLDEMIVEVLAFTFPDLIILQIGETDNQELLKTFEAFEQMLSVMQIESESQPMLEPPYMHKICSSQYNLDKRWYRAVVIQDMTDDGGSNLMVQYVDYGNTEIVPVDRIRQMKSEWLSVPLNSLYVQIAGYRFSTRVPADQIVQNLMESFRVTGSITAKIIKREKNLHVELVGPDGNLLYQDLIDRNLLVPHAV
ncbi:TUDOR [Nesidiocoris tenuis]|uniref:TUDOR n=1 Tax=Nesidiocoris tenuis TaxID=355587 RepID=A0ABN7ANU6_9HEMI|nr:TUDOR [Nesidiocoris tenuis]